MKMLLVHVVVVEFVIHKVVLQKTGLVLSFCIMLPVAVMAVSVITSACVKFTIERISHAEL